MAKKAEKEVVKKKVAQTSFLKRRMYEITVFVFSFLLYFNSVPNDYNLDDYLVTRNHRLSGKGISAIPEIFTSPYYQDAQGYAYEYRPVVLTTFAIEHDLFGDNPQVSHFFNLILYTLCCVLLFVVLRRLLNRFSPLLPLAIALIFVAHPAHTEVVCNIKNRDEILGLLFSFLSMLIAHKAVVTGRKWLLLLLPAVFMLGLMSKITVLCFIVIIPLALMLFTGAGFVMVMATVMLLAFPSFFLLNVGDLYSKLVIEAGLIFAVAGLYWFINYTQLVSAAKRLFARITRSATSPGEPTSESPSAGFKNMFTGINPGKQTLAFLPIAIVALTSAVFFIGIIAAYWYVVAAAALALLALAWRGEEKISWWAHVAVYACLVFSLVKYPFLNQTLYCDLVSALLVLQLIYGNRKLFMPTLVAYLFYVTFAIVTDADVKSLVWLVMLLIPRIRIRQVGWAVVVLVSIAGAHALVRYLIALNTTDLSVFTTTNSIGATLLAITMLIVMLNKGVRQLMWGYRFIAFFLVIAFQLNYDNRPFEIQRVQKGIVQVGKQVNTNILTTVQYRPLNYVEQPIQPNDPWQLRMGTSLEIVLHYFYKVILPYPMAYYYGYKFIKPMNITDPLPLMGLVIHVLLIAIALTFIRRNKLLSFGLFVYLVSIAMFSNYVYSIPGQIAERFLFVPSIGWAIVLVLILAKIFKVDFARRDMQWPALPKTARYVFAACLTLYSVITFARNFQWEDDLTLFRHDIKYVDKSAQAHNLLAIHLVTRSYEVKDAMEQKQLREEALVHLRRALEIYPRFFNVTYDIARVYALLEKPDSAIEYMKKTIAMDSTFTDAHSSAGKMLLSMRRYDEATPYFKTIINRYPTDYSGYDNLSYLYFSSGQYAKSIEVNREAAAKIPTSPLPLINIGRTYLGVSRADSARYYFRLALQVEPNNPMALELLKQIGN